MAPVELYVAAARIVAREYRLPVDAVLMPVGWEARRARHVALYLAHVGARVSMKALTRITGIERHTLRDSVRSLEDRRDDPAFDARLTRLEEALAHAA